MPGLMSLVLSLKSLQKEPMFTPLCKGWMEDIKAFIKTDILDFPYPIIADKGRELAVRLGMIDPEEKDSQGMPLTCRAVSFSPYYKYVV